MNVGFKMCFVLLLTFCGTGAANAQLRGQAALDSMLPTLQKMNDDTDKVNLLYKISIAYRNLNLDEAVKYADRMNALAAKLDWKQGMAKANMLNGVLSRRKGDYSLAAENFSKALAIYEDLGDKTDIAGAYRNIANLAADEGNKPKALDYYFRGLKIYEELGDKLNIARQSVNIGLLYSDEGNRVKALEYYFKALKKFDEAGQKDGIGLVLGNIGLTYSQQDDDLKAIEYYSKAIQADEETGDRADLAVVIANLGHSYVKLHNYSKGIENIGKAIKIDEEIGEKGFLSNNLQYMGAAYLSLATDTSGSKIMTGIAGNREQWLKTAVSYLQRGVAVGKEAEYNDAMQNCYGSLTDACRLMGDYKNALLYSDSFYVLRDSSYSNDSKVKMANLATRREEELKEKQIAINKLVIEKKRNERIFFGVGLCLLLLIVSGLFLSRKAIKKEKDISEGLLLNILPAEVAEELKQKGSAEAKLIDEVTVLFTDFKGFTQLSEKLSPQDLIAEINNCFSAFDHIMGRHGIEKIKTIGDSYMAAGGLPTPNSTHATDVVTAALEIQQYMHEHKATKEAAGQLFFEIRIGIHTGPVVAGIVGVKKFQYDIWGDTVNTASRMESSGEPGKVNISQTTYDIVKDKFKCDYRGEVTAKNKGMMKMYFVSRDH